MFSEMMSEIVEKVAAIDSCEKIEDTAFTDLLYKAANSDPLAIDESILLLANVCQNRESVIDFAANKCERPHSNEILLLPPLYFDSSCENNCLYCDFNANGNRLTLEEFEQEFKELLSLGYRSIELVSSQDPFLYRKHADYSHENQLFNADEALKYFKLAKELIDKSGGGMLTSNIPPLDVESNHQMKEAGLDCFLIWLETFNNSQYSRLHSDRGPKANQAFRLNSFERASKADINHLAGAFLKGLFDWRQEEVMLYYLDSYLKKTIGQGLSIVGTPRLKGEFANSEIVNKYKMNDEDYELNIALDRILFDGLLWLQTRESFETNLDLMKKYGAGVVLTLSSCTAPGGYSAPPKARSQFPVHKQDLDASVSALENAGFTCRFDWNSKTLSSFVR